MHLMWRCDAWPDVGATGSQCRTKTKFQSHSFVCSCCSVSTVGTVTPDTLGGPCTSTLPHKLLFLSLVTLVAFQAGTL